MENIIKLKKVSKAQKQLIEFKLNKLHSLNINILNCLYEIKEICLYETNIDNTCQYNITDISAYMEVKCWELFGQYFGFNVYDLEYGEDLYRYDVFKSLSVWLNSLHLEEDFNYWLSKNYESVEYLLIEECK